LQIAKLEDASPGVALVHALTIAHSHFLHVIEVKIWKLSALTARLFPLGQAARMARRASGRLFLYVTAWALIIVAGMLVLFWY